MPSDMNPSQDPDAKPQDRPDRTPQPIALLWHMEDGTQVRLEPEEVLWMKTALRHLAAIYRQHGRSNSLKHAQWLSDLAEKIPVPSVLAPE